MDEEDEQPNRAGMYTGGDISGGGGGDNWQHSELPKLALDSEIPPRALVRRRAFATCSSRPEILQDDHHNDDDDDLRVSLSTRRQRRGGISVERSQSEHIEINVAAPRLYFTSKLESVLTQVEYTLLTGLRVDGNETRHFGRFLKLHQKQKRRPLENTQETDEERALLDDAYYQQALSALSRVGQWNFNTFFLDSMTGGRSLPTLLLHLFQQYNLIETFRLDIVRVWKCFSLIEDGYHSNNPYHNAVHATDVTQAMHCFLQENKIREHITPLEVMTSLLAAVTHDLDHPGVNQPFLVATSNHLAALYNNSSVLENHHWRSAMGCLFQSGMLNHLDSDQWDEVTYQIRSLILATDITRQPEFLCRLRHYIDTNFFGMDDDHNRHFVLQIALKCADICNPCRPWEISTRWSRKVCEEFFRQGDSEKKLNLPVTALCDRNGTTIAKIQSGFFRFVVAPLFEEWNRFLQTPLSCTLVTNLKQNQEKWAMIEAEEIDLERRKKDVFVGTTLAGVDSCSGFSAPKLQVKKGFGRRHSVPLGLKKTMPRLATHLEAVQFCSGPLSSISLTSPVEEEVVPSTNEPSPSSSSSSSSSSNLISAQMSSSRQFLFKQSTYSPPSIHSGLFHRQLKQSVEVKTNSPSSSSSSSNGDCNADGKCSNNGCGTPSSIADEDDLSFITADIEDRDDTKANLTLHDDGSNSKNQNKPLLRLKSDSDLLQHKLKTSSSSSQNNNKPNKRMEEKENADPSTRCFLFPCKSFHHRKTKSHVGNGGSRLLSRRGSAPVSLLNDDVPNLLRLGGKEEIEKPRRRGSAPILLIEDQLPRNLHLNPCDRARSGVRRGSLPTEITFDTTVAAVTVINDLIHQGVTEARRTSDLMGTAFRRRSMPAEDLCHHRSSAIVPNGLSELFPVPGRSRSSNGVNHSSSAAHYQKGGFEWPNGFVRSMRSSHLMRQTQSFDVAFMDELVSLAKQQHVQLPLEFKRPLPSSSSSSFPFRRRGSVPVDACLFTLSPEDHSEIEDLAFNNAMQS